MKNTIDKFKKKQTNTLKSVFKSGEVKNMNALIDICIYRNKPIKKITHDVMTRINVKMNTQKTQCKLKTKKKY